MRVLVACEFSGVVRDAFRLRGHDAWSCDLLPAEDGSAFHYQGDIFKCADFGVAYSWDLMIAHPPCTYLCRAGYHWVNKPDSSVLPLKGEPRRRAMLEAATFFKALMAVPVPHICIENPRPIEHAGLPKSSQVIQPWEFGHGEVKETHLWLKNLPALKPSKFVDGREAKIHRMPPGKERSMARSRTFAGIANAMADQWGSIDVGATYWTNTYPQAKSA